MRKLLILALLALPAFGAYNFSRSITIDSTLCGSSNSSDFPVLVKITGATSVKTTANGGRITHTGAQTGGASVVMPYDLVFSSDAAGTSTYPWEIESYDGSAGTLIAWVKIPTVSHSAPTVFYMAYGDSSITTQQNFASVSPANVWNANYVMAAHITNGTVLSLIDSTSVSNTLTNHSSSASAGQIDGAVTVGSGHYVDAGTNTTLTGVTSVTAEVWAKYVSAAGAVQMMLSNWDSNAFTDGYEMLIETATGKPFAQYSVNGGTFRAIHANSAVTSTSIFHMVFTFDAASGVSHLYINGAPQTDTFTDVNGMGANTHAALGIGQRIVGSPTAIEAWSSWLDEIRVSDIARGADWILTTYNNGNASGNIGTPGFLTYGAETAPLIASQTLIPFKTANVVNLTGNGTSWTGGTTFTATGVTGASVTSQSVTSGTAATITITTGNYTGILTVSDGTNTASITVSHPGFNAVWSGPTLGTGTANSGDTWLLMDTVNGIRSIANDNLLVGSSPCGSCPCGRAESLWAISPSLSMVTLINSLSGFGDACGATNLGLCTGGNSIHNGSPFTYNGKYVLPMRCTTENYTTFTFSTSHDDWAHLFRAQDWTAVSAGSCAAGVATLTTSGSASVSGDLVMISHVGVVADREYTLTVGSNATTLIFSATCTGSGFTTGSAIGPGSANGVPYTTAMWDVASANNMGHPMVVNYCVDNVGCSPVVDSNDTYLNGFSIKFNTYDNPIAFRVLKTDMDMYPGDATKYTYLQADGTYGALATAVELQCTIQGTTAPCPSNWTSYFFGVSYFADAALPDGGQYIAAVSSGQMGLLTASHISGPFTFVPAYPVSSAFTPPVPEVSAISAPSLYHSVSSSPYIATLRVQYAGYFISAHYQQIYKDLTLTLKQPNESPIFNSAPTPGVAGNGGKYHHVESGLVAYWDMTSADLLTLKDQSMNALDIPISSSPTPSVSPLSNIFITSAGGIENTNSTLNASWTSLGGAWKVPTGFGQSAGKGQNLGDFTVHFVVKNDPATTQYLMGGPVGSAAGFAAWTSGASAGDIGVQILGTGAYVVCPAPSTNTWEDYIAMRKSGKLYCFRSTTATPTVSAGTDSTLLGTYNLNLGSASDTQPFWNGSIGTVLIWNRALCSTQVAGTCAAGQVDEVLREFTAIHLESPSRGWGL